MPDATITSTASTFGTISGTFAADQSTITGTLSGTVAGTLTGSVGVPGPGLPAGGEEGQIIVKQSATDYDTAWQDNYAATLQATVRNETGATLSKGTVVYISGGAGNKPLVTKASASSESSSSKTFAILAEDIPTNQNGQAVTMGLLKGLDTTAFTAGANLWLSTTAGQIVSPTPPATPAHAVFLGNVVRVHATQGEIEVRIQNGLELAELHDVLLTSPTEGQVLKYDATSGLWVNGTDSSGVAWGSITGTLSSQTDLQTALDGKYSTTNPAGYITSSALSGYATESFVTSQGYITSSALSPYLLSSTAASTYQTIAAMSSYLTTSAAASTYYPLTNPSGYITSSALTGYATESWVTSQGYLTSASLSGYATESWVTAGFYPLTGNPSGFLTSASLSGYATESWVTSQLGSYLTTSTAASTYAALAGATFSGVVSFNGSSGVAAKSIGQFKSYTSGFESTDYSLQYDTGFQVVQSGTTVARLSASGLLLPSGGITFSDATTQTTAGITAAAVAATYAPLASPALTGNPTAPTPATADNDTSIATTAFVKAQGYLTTAPVTSVAGKTGAVTLAVADVSGAAPLASPTFTGTPAAPTATAGTSTTQLATTAFVTTADNLKANLASPTFTGTPAAPTAAVDTNTTQLATTAYVVGQGYLKSATASSTYAPLASPSLTGTPTAPTATTGTNTTQIATTAFVQQEVPAASTTAAGKVELATTDEALRPSSNSLAMTPDTTREMLLYPGYIQMFGGGNYSTSGTGATNFVNGTQRWHANRSPNAGIAGYAMYIFDYSFTGIGMAAMTRGVTSIGRKWNSKIWVSGRSVLGQWAETTSGLNGDANCTARVMLGGRSSAATGGMQAADPGIGWKVAGGGSAAIVMTVSNGSALTETTSSFTPTLGQVFDWKMYSDGTGNVTLWVNDSQVATSTGGPTTSTTENYNFYCEVAEQTASATAPFALGNFGTKVFWSQA